MTVYSLDVLLSYLEPVCCSMSSSNCCFLTCIQISQEADQVIWYSHLFQNVPQFIVIHTVKGFGIVKKAEIDVFLELSCFFHDPADVGNLICGSSAFSKTSFCIILANLLLNINIKRSQYSWFKLEANQCQKVHEIYSHNCWFKIYVACVLITQIQDLYDWLEVYS